MLQHFDKDYGWLKRKKLHLSLPTDRNISALYEKVHKVLGHLVTVLFKCRLSNAPMKHHRKHTNPELLE